MTENPTLGVAPDRVPAEGADVDEKTRLERRLGALQREARAAGVPVVVVFEGWSASGKGTCINALLRSLDPRGFAVWSIDAPNEEERLRPYLWRFWTKLPARGMIAVFDRSWYRRVLEERVEKVVEADRWQPAYEDIARFERQLTDDGVVLVKFWLHIDKKEQRRRLKRTGKRAAEAWRVTPDDWRQHKHYEQYLEAVEEMRARTTTAAAPWVLVDAKKRKAARLQVFQTLVTALEQALNARRLAHQGYAPGATTGPGEPETNGQPANLALSRTGVIALSEQPARDAGSSALAGIDLTKRLSRKAYERDLPKLQRRLRELGYTIYKQRIPVVVTYEGWDAAGKGGNIRRLTQRLDPRGYRVVPITAPTAEERAHHYLWRFWRHLPKDGHMVIFDRTWYGRVLVERVEGFSQPEEWQRAYQEINEFEEHLVDHGTVLVKFWLHIDPEEQLRRFKERQEMPWKQWKITDEDWRNREQWRRYEGAVADMLQRTSTPRAPWTVVESVDKLYARIKALRTVVEAIETAI
jgi:AMP-polyphosphate phosphotransferase